MRVGHDPWKANTLEWFTTSPPPVNNFDIVPRVRSLEPMQDIRRQIARDAGTGTAPAPAPAAAAEPPVSADGSRARPRREARPRGGRPRACCATT